MSHEPLEDIARTLIERDCYVLLSSQGANFGGRHIAGLYSRRLDLMARPWLQSQNRWRGRMPAVFIDDRRLNDTWQILATLCHELGHCCDLGHDDTPENEHSEVFVDFQRRTHERTKDEPVLRVEKCPLHGDRFLRATVHLWWRCFQAVHWFPPELLWQGELYGQPEPWQVSRALGDELKRLEELPVSLIVNLPVTSEPFEQLFRTE